MIKKILQEKTGRLHGKKFKVTATLVGSLYHIFESAPPKQLYLGIINL